MSVAELIEIIRDETIELLDEHHENILLRMMGIKNKFNNEGYIQKKYFLLDSKKRFYVFGYGLFPKIEKFYYSSTYGLSLDGSWVAIITGDSQIDDINDILITDPMSRYFYDNRDEYWPSNGLTNFELK